MRKKIISTILCTVICASLCACGAVDASKSGTTDDGKDIVYIQTQEATQKDEQPTVPTSWIEEQGIVTAPSGSGTFHTNMKNADRTQNIGVVDIPYTIKVEEIRGVDKKGYKRVVATFVEDCTPSNDEIVADWITAFDAYTGFSFEKNDETIMVWDGEDVNRENAITIEHNGTQYDVLMYKEATNRWPIVEYKITVICPEDYDGAVFQVGGSSVEQADMLSQVDFNSRLWLISELPYYGEGYYYYRFE